MGMTPADFRKDDTETRFAVGRCSLGAILVASSAKGVCAILFGSDPASLRSDLERQFPGARLIEGDESFRRLMAKVTEFVENPRNDPDFPLDVRGTAFQHRVWEALRRIPPGATASYAAVAASIGAPRAVRAVARACATNRLAVAIPCHRVVASDGSLSGYRGGVERKRALLAKEAQS